MQRAVVISLVAFGLAVSVAWGAAERTEVANLVRNGGFEEADAADASRPAEFRAGRVETFERHAKLTWEGPGFQSDKCVAVETLDSNDLGYWETVVPVKPETAYFISLHYKCRSVAAADAPVGEAVYNKGRPGGPNLELGVVPDDASKLAKPNFWTDIGWAMDPVGGAYLPLATEWTRHRQTIKTIAGQTRMKIKLRLFCYEQKVWFDDLSVVEVAVAPETIDPLFRADRKAWAEKDTTPPTVFLPNPAANAAAKGDAIIGATFSDVGSGVDVASATVLLDGKDVTRDATVTPKGIRLRPRAALPGGPHRVAVSVADKAGNRSNRLGWQFGVGAALQNETKLIDDTLHLNGEPFFPIGIYCYHLHPSDGRFGESGLAAATAAGYDVLLNTVEPHGEGRKNMDTLLKYGMKCLLNISSDMKSCDTPASAKVALLEKGQARLRDHPTVLGYWADDPENLEDTKGTAIQKGTLGKMGSTRKVLKEANPHYPLVWAMSNMPRFKEAVPSADILLPYRYAVPHYHPQMIYGWMLHYVYTVSEGKPVWFNSQGVDLGRGAGLGCGHTYGTPFKPTDIIRPTPAEMRVMAFYSLVVGVKGYTLYGNYLTPQSHPRHWPAALKMASEMRHLAPALAAGKDVRTATLRADSTFGSIYFREIEYEGAHTLIAANVSAGRVATTWEFKKPTWAIALFEDRVMRKPSTEVQDVFEPFEVHVYRWSDRDE